jgi:hypothetical protein
MTDTEQVKFIERILKTSSSDSNKKSGVLLDSSFENRDVSIWNTLLFNSERLGNNNFALYNALTDYASRESSWELRNKYFLNIGRYLSNEILKGSRMNRKKWSEKLVWQDVEKLREV